MNREVRAAVLAVAVLVLAGCAASEASEPAPSTPAPAAPSFPPDPICLPLDSVPACTEKLAGVVVIGGGAFDRIEDPTLEQVRADIVFDHAGARWAETCRHETDVLVGDLSQACVDLIGDLGDAAAVVDAAFTR